MEFYREVNGQGVIRGQERAKQDKPEDKDEEDEAHQREPVSDDEAKFILE
jgi:hypothetical protein